MLNLTLRQLEYALAIGRHGGLTAAAEALHVSQPALSVALAQLETTLGQPLFLRRPKGLVPTAFGSAWLAQAETHVAGLGLLMTGALAAPFRLGVFEDLAPASLGPLIAWARGQGLALAPRIMGFQALSEAFQAGEVDAALSWALGLPPGPREEIARIAPMAVMAASHPLAARASLTLAELAEAPLVLTDQDLSVAHVQSLFHARGLGLRIAHRCASLDLMRSFAANGLGVGLSWTQPAPRISHDGRPLVLVPLSDAPPEPVVLAGAPSPEAARIARFLRAELQPMATQTPKPL